MHYLHVLAASALAVFQASPLIGQIRRSDFVLVRSIVDGNTIVVSNIGRVRLLGIAAPKLGRGLDTSAPFAGEARDRLTALLLNRWVRVEPDGSGGGAASRHAGYVVTGDGTFVNATLVREGLARVVAHAALSRLAELQHAEAEAQASRRGMWGSAPQIPPAGYTPDARAIRSPAGKSKKSTKRKKQP